eukprot:5390130-Pyramimonas_sp.AAC.1
MGLQNVACKNEQRALWVPLAAFLDQLLNDEDNLLSLGTRSKRGKISRIISSFRCQQEQQAVAIPH